MFVYDISDVIAFGLLIIAGIIFGGVFLIYMWIKFLDWIRRK